jgi:hypothetical protein
MFFHRLRCPRSPVASIRMSVFCRVTYPKALWTLQLTASIGPSHARVIRLRLLCLCSSYIKLRTGSRRAPYHVGRKIYEAAADPWMLSRESPVKCERVAERVCNHADTNKTRPSSSSRLVLVTPFSAFDGGKRIDERAPVANELQYTPKRNQEQHQELSAEDPRALILKGCEVKCRACQEWTKLVLFSVFGRIMCQMLRAWQQPPDGCRHL